MATARKLTVIDTIFVPRAVGSPQQLEVHKGAEVEVGENAGYVEGVPYITADAADRLEGLGCLAAATSKDAKRAKAEVEAEAAVADEEIVDDGK